MNRHSWLFVVLGCLGAGWCLADTVQYPVLSRADIVAVYHIVTIRGAQMDHHANSEFHSFAESLSELNYGARTRGLSLLAGDLADGQADGYSFRLRGTDPVLFNGRIRYRGWVLEVRPEGNMPPGRVSMYCDQRGVIRAGDAGGEWGSETLPELPEHVVMESVVRARAIVECRP